MKCKVEHGQLSAFDNDLSLLLCILPEPLRKSTEDLPKENLLEIVMDLGRVPEARFPGLAKSLTDRPVTREDLDHVTSQIGEFGADNRAGIERTLHRISAIRNRKGEIIGLTLRVGRAVFGTVDMIRDLIETGANILLVGRPGVGKTTMLREAARVLADELGKRVVIVDTSNEIAGDGDIPHPSIGRARRMQVPHPAQQHAVMIEAVENHMPEVIIVDEIGTYEEALAARTIAERGVQLIGTAHGNTLENLVMNPTLSDVVGGVQTVTLGDEEARIRGTQKTISERKGPPTFDMVVEIVNRDELIVHRDTAKAVDELLRGFVPSGERRVRDGDGKILTREERPTPHEAPRPFSPGRHKGPVRIYPYALNRDSLKKVIRDLGLDARAVRHPEQADMILALRSRSEDKRLQRYLMETGAFLHLVKRNSTAQIRRLLQNVFFVVEGVDDHKVQEAVSEAEHAARRVIEEGITIELAPQPPALRKVQHRVVTQYRLASVSVGTEPTRHLVIHPG